jgi:protocatechuate 3,4-dioxygenase beta subunit
MNSKLGIVFVVAVLVAVAVGGFFLLGSETNGPDPQTKEVPEKVSRTSETPVLDNLDGSVAAPVEPGEAMADESPEDGAPEEELVGVAKNEEEAKKRRVGRGTLNGSLSYMQEKGDLSKVKVEVTLVDWEDHEERGADALTRTPKIEADGTFTLNNLPWGSYVAIATSSDGFFGIDDAGIAERHKEGNLSFQLFPEGAISGQVTTEGGDPVAGARVVATHYSGMLGDTNIDRDWAKALATRTDESGAFELAHLIDGTYELVALAAGYGSGQVKNIKIGTQNAHIVLPGSGSASGSVIDEYSGDPVPDVKVKLASTSWLEKHEAVSDAQGEFSFSAVPAGAHRVAIDHAQYIAAADTARIEVKAGEEATGITLHVVLGGLLTGRVYDKESEKGVSGAKIYLATMDGGKAESRIHKEATSDADGNYTFDGLATGAYTLRREEINGYPNSWEDPTMRKNVTLRAGEELRDVDFALSQGLTIRGRVIDEGGEAIANVSLHANTRRGGNAQTRSQDDGRFVLAGLMPEVDYHIQPYKSGMAGATTGPVRVSADSVPDDVEIVMYAESTVSGIVVDPAGKPLGSIHLYSRAHGTTQFGGGSGETGADGKFKIERMPPGDHDIVLSGRNGYMTNQKAAETVHIAQSGEHIEGLRLVYEGGGGLKIQGQIVDGEGKGISNANVQANGPSHDYVNSDGEGNFELSGLSEGAHSLYVNHGSYSTVREQGIEAGSTGVVIEMRGRGTVEGQVFDAQSRQPVTEFSVIQEHGARNQISPHNLRNMRPILDEEGRFILPDVEEGDATIAVTASGYAMATQVVNGIVADETLSGVEVFLEAGFSLEGVVVDSNGSPVSGALIFHGQVPQEYERDRAKKTITGGDGLFVIDGLPQGENTISAYHANFAPGSTIANVGPSANSIELVLGLGATVEGTVLMNGKPVPNAYINVMIPQGSSHFQTHAQVDPDGAYQLKGLPEGDAMIHAGFQLEDDQRRSLQVQETLQYGMTHTVNFDVDEGTAVIRGVLLESAGNPLSGHVNTVIESGGSTENSFQQVGADGQFEFTGVIAGNVRVMGRIQTAGGYRQISKSLVVEAGGVYEVELNLDSQIQMVCRLLNPPQGEVTQAIVFHGEHSIPADVGIGFFQQLTGDMVTAGQAVEGEVSLSVPEPGSYTVVGMVHQGAQEYALTSTIITVTEGQESLSVDLAF